MLAADSEVSVALGNRLPEYGTRPKRIINEDTNIVNMAATDPPDDSVVTVVNPEEDDVTVELEFYDEAMEGVEGVSMPDASE